MSENELTRIIRSLETVMEYDHAIIPVPRKDLRLLIEAARAFITNASGRTETDAGDGGGCRKSPSPATDITQADKT